MAVISPITTQAPVVSTPLLISAAVGAPAAPVQQRPVQQTSVQQAPVEQQVSEEHVKQVVDQANQLLASNGSNVGISFAYEQKLNQLYVTVVDQNTGDVIREIPSKDFIRQRVAMREMIGLILDKQA